MKRRQLKIAGVSLLVLSLLGGLALVTARAQQESRTQLEERFALRAALGASFATSYVQSTVRAEQRRAERALAGKQVSERAFIGVVDALEFQAAVLLDSKGRAVHLWPRKPELIGSDLGSRYAHLRTAVAGGIGVSQVIPSAVEKKPIVAFAVPFASAGGRRVFSGAFDVKGTPLEAYLSTALPFTGGELLLVDGEGTLIIDRRPAARGVTDLTAVDADLAAALDGRNEGRYSRAGETRFFASAPVTGTDWSILVSVPTEQLLAPIGGFKSYIPWILFAAFTAAAAAAAFLVSRLAEHRRLLAASNSSLARSNDELRDLDRIKDEFVALVSHELRTPLTSIIGYVSALQRGRAGVVSAEQRELLDVAERNSQRLLRLIGDLLLAAKSDAGKLELERESIDLGALARQAVDAALPHAAEQGVELEFSTTAALPLVADPARVLQVLDNLISNAIKFSPDGGVVHVALSAAGPSAVLEVRDDGIGIPAEEREQLFRRFFRASTATAREIQGTGLGLSIVKTIVELHDGEIECHDGERGGTTFVVRLPLDVVAEVAA